MAYRVEIKNAHIYLRDGFSGTSTIEDSSIVGGDTTLLLDEDAHDLHDDAVIIPVGSRFRGVNVEDTFTVSAANSNAQLSITIGADTTGTYTVTVDGATTSALNGTDNAATLEAAIEGLGTVGAGNASVTGSGTAMSPFIVEFIGDLADTAVVASATDTDLDNFAASQLHAGGKTWQVTFTPALTAGDLPANASDITWLRAQLENKVGEGTFDWSEKKELIQDYDRDLLDGVREGKQQPVDVNTSFVFDFLRASSGGSIRPYEAINRIGGAAGWHNAAIDKDGNPSPCEPYALQLVVVTQPPCGSEQAEVFFFDNFRATEVNPTIQDAVVNLTGQASIVRADIRRMSEAELIAEGLAMPE
jgi:hypothetical protein